MNHLLALSLRIVHLVVIALAIAHPLTATSKDLADRGDLVAALENNGIKLGQTVWLRVPMGELPGLTKIIIKDADVRPRYQFTRSYLRLVVIAEVEGKGESVLELTGTAYFYEGPEGTAGQFYLSDPKARVAKWGKKVLKAIADKKVFLGMTEEQVKTSWGWPASTHASVGRWGKREQWVFGESPASYLYFDNGKLSSWQD